MENKEKTLGILPLAMFAIGTTLASGVYTLSGDFAASGAYTLATLIGWATDNVLFQTVRSKKRTDKWNIYLCKRRIRRIYRI